jgi:hypothetical protein
MEVPGSQIGKPGARPPIPPEKVGAAGRLGIVGDPIAGVPTEKPKMETVGPEMKGELLP